jgi:hypothetical protein
MTASITKQVEKRLAEMTIQGKSSTPDEPTHDEARAYIMSLLEEKKPTILPPKKVTLKSIMAKSKNTSL